MYYVLIMYKGCVLLSRSISQYLPDDQLRLRNCIYLFTTLNVISVICELKV